MNASATFQRLMDRVLRGLTLHQCLVYVDDLLIFAKTLDRHLEHLENVFVRLREANIKLKPEKCRFGENEVDYLGFQHQRKRNTPIAEKKLKRLLSWIHLRKRVLSKVFYLQ